MAAAIEQEPALVPLKDVAAALALSPLTVRRLVARRELPPPVKIARRIMFRAEDLRRFIAGQGPAWAPRNDW